MAFPIILVMNIEMNKCNFSYNENFMDLFIFFFLQLDNDDDGDGVPDDADEDDDGDGVSDHLESKIPGNCTALSLIKVTLKLENLIKECIPVKKIVLEMLFNVKNKT